MDIIKTTWLTATIIFCPLITYAESNTAPDATKPGPYQVTSAEYRLPAKIDSDVLEGTVTEVWGKIFYPINSDSAPSPLVVMLHGNHSTCGRGSNPRIDDSCQYTYSGTCPEGYVPTPNHEGYDYLAKNLASWGFVVASINANRGITCGYGDNGDWGLNIARGKLVLKHLSLLYQWSKYGAAPFSTGKSDALVNKINFASVGLLGHSRGGEGVRAAYNLFKDDNSPWPAKIPGLAIKAIFEIGAVDGQTNRVFNADGIAWNQLLPMCDGDVSDLQGRYPFERMMNNKSENPDAQKSLYEVWGANHNFFNTEWQLSDSRYCMAGKPLFDTKGGTSIMQQQVALASVPAFFRSWLGKQGDAGLDQNFNPLDSLPASVTDVTHIDRDFTPSPGSAETMVLDDFDKETGTNSAGYKNLYHGINIQNHELEGGIQRAAEISWQTAGAATYFEVVLADQSKGRDLHDYATLDFRVGRENISDAQSRDPYVNFSIALQDAAGIFSKEIPVSDYAIIDGPANYEPILMTVRIPLSVFQGVDLARVHSVRFRFNKSKKDSIYLANIRAQRELGRGVDNIQNARVNSHPAMLQLAPPPVEYVPANLNKVTKVSRLNKTLMLSGSPAVEISFSSQVPFPVRDSLPILKIGNKTYKLGRYTDMVHLKELTFTLTNEQYANIPKDAEVSISNGKVWKFKPIK